MNQALRTAARDGRIGHFIDGAVVTDGDRTLPVHDPALGRAVREVCLADAATVNFAVGAAAASFEAWRDLPPLRRARVMFRFKELLERHSGDIAALVSQEHGKLADDARGELQRGIENVEYACAAPELLKGEHSRNAGPGIDSWSEFQPLGVVAGITPFNFPVMVPLWMFPLALVCGNTFVLKPSEKDPGSTLRMAELLHEAGLPPGVFNLVNGDREAVDALLAHPLVEAVSFVGSTPVAGHVHRQGTANGKRVQALGGAKNHMVVMPDADLDNVVNALVGAAYGSCGERCMAISVVVAVGERVADELVARLSRRVELFSVGPASQQGHDFGPLVSSEHLARVRGHVEAGVAEGARLVVDGRGLRVPGHEQGWFLGPCLFDHVTPGMQVHREEIFGPVLCVLRVATLDEALAVINGHEYGNGGCIFTRDGGAARYFSDRVRVGMVGVNVPLPVPMAFHSFGGWKRSLFGDLGAYGPDGLRFYTRRKTITQRWPEGGVRELAEFAFPAHA